MTIRVKLALGLLSIGLALLAPIAVSLLALETLHAATQVLRDNAFRGSVQLGRLRGSIDDLRQLEMSVLFGDRPEDALPSMQSNIRRVLAMTDSLKLNSDLRDAARDITPSVEALTSVATHEYQAMSFGSDSAKLVDSLGLKQFAPAIAAARARIALAEDSLQYRTQLRVNAAEQGAQIAWNAAKISLAVATTFALIIGTLLWRAISRPVEKLEAGMAAVADGNFRYRLGISPERRDEFGRLASSFQSMAEQLAQLDRLRAEFISIASHELKTPINVIVGYLQLLEEGVYGPTTAKQREVIETLDAQTRALSRLVAQLLDIGRFQAGGGKLDLRPTDLDQFLAELEGTFRVLAMQRSIDFRIARHGPLPREVLWDFDRINEVLGNLLANAFKFTESGGSVDLMIEGVEDRVQFQVRDTGIGIPAQQLPHIFEKFYQADNQDGAMGVGTGLGLAIAREIVAAHHGEITVESTVGVGTTFTIRLPATALLRRSLRRPPPVADASAVA